MKIRPPWILFGMMALALAGSAQSRLPDGLWSRLTSPDHPALGPADAPVTVVEFADFECPHCAVMFSTLQSVRKNYGESVRIVFRQFPLAHIHPNARKAAEASLCAHEQERFGAYHDSLFANQQELSVDALKRRAAQLGLDRPAFDRCLDSGKHAATIESDMDDGEEAGVFSTPTMFINGRRVEGNHPYATIARIIDAELQHWRLVR